MKVLPYRNLLHQTQLLEPPYQARYTLVLQLIVSEKRRQFGIHIHPQFGEKVQP